MIGQVVEAARVFGKAEENVEVVVYDPDSQAAIKIVAWGWKGERTQVGSDLALLTLGETADLRVGVSVYEGRLQVRPKAVS